MQAQLTRGYPGSGAHVFASSRQVPTIAGQIMWLQVCTAGGQLALPVSS